MKSIPRSRQTPLKSIPYRAARPRWGHLREYPPPRAWASLQNMAELDKISRVLRNFSSVHVITRQTGNSARVHLTCSADWFITAERFLSVCYDRVYFQNHEKLNNHTYIRNYWSSSFLRLFLLMWTWIFLQLLKQVELVWPMKQLTWICWEIFFLTLTTFASYYNFNF